MNKQDNNLAYKVSGASILLNILLSAFKFVAGILSASGAMISDAVHSASDVISTIVVIAGIKASSKKSDSSHPYGHERMECIASIILSVLLFITSISIGYNGLKQIITGTYEGLTSLGMLALIAAIVSILIKELMYHFTMHAAKKINSDSLKADAWHHRSDALSSVGSLIGIGGAMLGIKVLDPIMSIVICLIIVKAAYDILKDSLDKMVDKSCDQQTTDKITELALSIDGVLGIDDIKTRLFGNKIYVDMEICADGNLTLNESHDIAEKVHNEIEKNFSDVKHIMIHVNPR